MKNKMPFEEVYSSCYDRVYKSVYMRILNRESTEDIVQDVFIKAMNAYDTYDPEKASVFTWISRIATNTLTDFFRKDKSDKIVSYDVFLENGFDPGAEDPELARLSDDYSKEAYIILKALTDEERELLMLRFGMELSYGEIAERIGSNEKAVAKRMQRLLTKCKEMRDKG